MNDLRYRLQGWDTKDLKEWLSHLREQRKQYDEKRAWSTPQYKSISKRISLVVIELQKRS